MGKRRNKFNNNYTKSRPIEINLGDLAYFRLNATLNDIHLNSPKIMKFVAGGALIAFGESAIAIDCEFGKTLLAATGDKDKRAQGESIHVFRTAKLWGKALGIAYSHDNYLEKLCLETLCYYTSYSKLEKVPFSLVSLLTNMLQWKRETERLIAFHTLETIISYSTSDGGIFLEAVKGTNVIESIINYIDMKLPDLDIMLNAINLLRRVLHSQSLKCKCGVICSEKSIEILLRKVPKSIDEQTKTLGSVPQSIIKLLADVGRLFPEKRSVLVPQLMPYERILCTYSFRLPVKAFVDLLLSFIEVYALQKRMKELRTSRNPEANNNNNNDGGTSDEDSDDGKADSKSLNSTTTVMHVSNQDEHIHAPFVPVFRTKEKSHESLKDSNKTMSEEIPEELLNPAFEAPPEPPIVAFLTDSLFQDIDRDRMELDAMSSEKEGLIDQPTYDTVRTLFEALWAHKNL